MAGAGERRRDWRGGGPLSSPVAEGGEPETCNDAAAVDRDGAGAASDVAAAITSMQHRAEELSRVDERLEALGARAAAAEAALASLQQQQAAASASAGAGSSGSKGANEALSSRAAELIGLADAARREAAAVRERAELCGNHQGACVLVCTHACV